MKHLITFLLLVSALTIMGSGVAGADQHDRLLPLLGDLEGWTAQPAKGSSMVSAQMKMISARRVYARGEKELIANIMVNSGPVIASDLQEVSAEDEVIKIRVNQIRGFWVKATHNKKNNTGQLLVYLDYNEGANSKLFLNYSKINEDEAMAELIKFDWKRMKSVVSAML